MRQKRKPNQGSFKKGRARTGGKPKGYVAHVSDEQKILKFDKTTLQRYLIQHTFMSIAELKAKEKDPRSNWIEAALCSVLLKIKSTGDVYAFDKLMDRYVGTVTQKVELSKGNPFENMTDEQLLEERQRLAKACEVHLRYVENTPQLFHPRIVKPVDEGDSKDESEPTTVIEHAGGTRIP